MPITVMSHFTILTNNLEATRAFYCDLLGLTEGWRPAFSFPGLWLYQNERPILHVIGGRDAAELRAGVIDHLAFDAVDLADTVARLDRAGVSYQLRRLAGAATAGWQLFFMDPNGAKVELDFDAAEAAPTGTAGA